MPVGTPSYLKQPLTIDFSNKITTKLEQGYRIQTFNRKFVNNGDLLEMGDAKGHRTFSTQQFQTVDNVPYITGSGRGWGDPEFIKLMHHDYSLEKTLGFFAAFESIYAADTQGILRAGKWMKVQVKYRVWQDVDQATFSKINSIAVANSYKTDYDSTKPWENIVDAQAAVQKRINVLDDLIMAISIDFKSRLKKDPNFNKDNWIAQKDVTYKGMVAMADGVEIVCVPDAIFPSGTEALMLHKDIMYLLIKLETADYKDAESFSGSLARFLMYYDNLAAETATAGIQRIA